MFNLEIVRCAARSRDSMGTDKTEQGALPRAVVADATTYRRALAEVIAAAYRALDTWEAGDLAGSVTALGEAARHWDRALGLGVTGTAVNTDEGEGDKDKEEGTRNE